MPQLLSELKVGAKVKFGKYQVNTETPEPIVWVIVAKNHPGYPKNSVTLLSASCVDNRCYDAPEPLNPIKVRQECGNNNYSLSNIDQWLNSDADAGKWYKPRHQYDAPPDEAEGNYGRWYAKRCGFLHWFSQQERISILTTTIKVLRTPTDGDEINVIDRKVFLPSSEELDRPSAYAPKDPCWSGCVLGIPPRGMSQQYITNSLDPHKPSSTSDIANWWLRGADHLRPDWAFGVMSGNVSFSNKPQGSYGFCPVINVIDSLKVSDGLDIDNCYTVHWGVAPSVPNSFILPEMVMGDRTATIEWSESTDPDGNFSEYVLERSVNAASFEEIYRGVTPAFVDSITFGWNTVRYRVLARDTENLQSEWLTSETRTVVNNKPAVISGTDENLGTKSEGFAQSYTVSDPESDRVTVEERIDDVLIRSHTPTLGETNVFSVTEDTWLGLFNGTHVMTVTAKDAIENITVRTYTFTKAVDSFTIQNIMPLTADIRPTRMRLSVTREIPAGATFTVYLCNNGFDSDPTWEDATSAVTGHLIHLFANTTKTAPAWGVGAKIEVTRGTGEGACYVSQIDGNYE